MPKKSVAEPTEPTEEEPIAASRHLRQKISCSVRDIAEGVGVEAQVFEGKNSYTR